MSKWLDVETDRCGRVEVQEDLSHPQHKEVFVIGDAVKTPWQDGLDVPGIAPAAKQAGAYVGRLISGEVSGAKRPAPFKYRHQGNLATIGRHAAVIDFGWLKMSGILAWFLWGVAHIFFLIGVRKRIIVSLNWAWSYISFSRGARLVTGLRPLYDGEAKSLLTPKSPQSPDDTIAEPAVGIGKD